MANILLFGKTIRSEETMQSVIDALHRPDVDLWMYGPFYEQCLGRVNLPENLHLMQEGDSIPSQVDYVFTVGGDGTFLDALPLVKDSELPMFGINTGRLGFLSNTHVHDFPSALESVLSGDFTLEKRMLLEIDHPACARLPWALNDVCIQRSGSRGMITVDVYINEEHLNTYWCDGLIIATPTGSTAYSLGCGGPILTPQADAVVLTPIASHTLTVRPIVLPADSDIRIETNSRSDNFVINADSNTYTIQQPQSLHVRKADFPVRLIQLKGHSFYKTLRDKLMWGLDRRN